MRCPLCGNAVVEISIRVRGEQVSMRSCTTCEARWWDRQGEALTIDAVLHLASA